VCPELLDQLRFSFHQLAPPPETPCPALRSYLFFDR